MNSLVRWEPFGGFVSLDRAMDHVFRNSFLRPSLARTGGGPRLDMYETDEGFVVKAAIPGLKPEDLEITVDGNTLTIKGEVRAEEDVEESHYVYRERWHGSFRRTVTLPKEVLADGVEAEFEDGVLTLTLPVVEPVQPKTIDVQVK